MKTNMSLFFTRDQKKGSVRETHCKNMQTQLVFQFEAQVSYGRHMKF